MIYLKLFLSFLQIGAFSFGGGYAALPLIQEQVVTLNNWLSLREFTDLITISQMTPGPIAINSATFGCILPSCIIVSLLAWVYMRYRKMAMIQGILNSLRPAVVAMIASAGLSIIVSAFWPAGFGNARIDIVVIFLLAIVLLRVKKSNPIAVMVLCGAAEIGYYLATAL